MKKYDKNIQIAFGLFFLTCAAFYFGYVFGGII